MITQAEITPRGRLIEVAEWLEAGAPHKGNIAGFDMSDYAVPTSCGTVCCIAGAIVEFEAMRRGIAFSDMPGIAGTASAHEVAEELCELPFDTAWDLFIPDVEKRWCHITPFEAAATIRRYLNTGVVSWDAP